MSDPRMPTVRVGGYCLHRNRHGREFITLRQAKRLIRFLNRLELTEPSGCCARIDRRRGWLVIEFYPIGLN